MTDHTPTPSETPEAGTPQAGVPGAVTAEAGPTAATPLTAGPPPPGRRTRKAARAAKPRGRFRVVRRIVGAVAGLSIVAAVVGGAFALHTYDKYAADLPTLDSLRNYQPKVMSRVYSGDSRLIAELATERRVFVPVSSIPDIVKQAFLSAEDQKFWSHKGVDPLAMVRAAYYDVALRSQGRRPIGASTITQQVAKNMLLSNEVSVARKVKELILAVRIDQSMSKEHVLELYLNEIFLGLQAYGVAAAAATYFNKGLDELTLPEAAFLAALPKAPNNYNPFRFPDAAKARRDWVLDRMTEDRAITPEQAAAAKATPIQPAPFRRPEFVTGSEWFAEEVRRAVIAQFGADVATTAGLTIRTSLDPALQTAADTALRKGLLAYDRTRGGWRGAIGHIEGGANMRLGWTNRLQALPRPAGLLPEWNLSVVLETTGDEAKIGWIERGGGGVTRTGSLYAADLAWARPARPNGSMGPVPRRVTDVVQVGDVIMTEPAGASAGTAGPRATPRPDRLWLRQVPQVQGALVSLDPTTGRILAMSGGWSGDSSQFNRATQAQRQPGSSFKPIVYLTALQAGLSPSQRILDAPFVQKLSNGEVWEPNNYGMTFSGPIAMRIALERSLNMVTIRLGERVGMDAVADNAVAFHVVDGMPRVLPATLGAVETTVLRQAAAYSALAMGGRDVLPSMVDSVQDRDGKVIWRSEGLACTGCDQPGKPPVITDKRPQIADPQSVFQLVTMMQGVVAKGTGFTAGAGLNRAIAGKTGTTQDSHDAWFVGFTPDLVTAVWIGFDNNDSLGDRETGGGLAAPIWHDYMAVALKNRPNLQFRAPDGVKMGSWDSGAGPRVDAFKPDQPPGGSAGTVGGNEGGGGGGGGRGRGGDGGLAVSSGVGVDSGMGGLY